MSYNKERLEGKDFFDGSNEKLDVEVGPPVVVEDEKAFAEQRELK